MVISSYSTQDTFSLGKKLYPCLEAKDVLILEGALGGGKTVLVQGILAASGYRGPVLSPSFTLVREYKRPPFTLYHADLYRIGEEDIFSTGLLDYLYSPASVTMVEWGEKIKDQLSAYLRIEFHYTAENSRRIRISSKGLPEQRRNRFKVFLDNEYTRG